MYTDSWTSLWSRLHYSLSLQLTSTCTYTFPIFQFWTFRSEKYLIYFTLRKLSGTLIYAFKHQFFLSFFYFIFCYFFSDILSWHMTWKMIDNFIFWWILLWLLPFILHRYLHDYLRGWCLLARQRSLFYFILFFVSVLL